MVLVTDGGYKASRDTAEQEKGMVVLGAVPGVAPCSLPSLFLHPAPSTRAFSHHLSFSRAGNSASPVSQTASVVQLKAEPWVGEETQTIKPKAAFTCSS